MMAAISSILQNLRNLSLTKLSLGVGFGASGMGIANDILGPLMPDPFRLAHVMAGLTVLVLLARLVAPFQRWLVAEQREFHEWCKRFWFAPVLIGMLLATVVLYSHAWFTSSNAPQGGYMAANFPAVQRVQVVIQDLGKEVESAVTAVLADGITINNLTREDFHSALISGDLARLDEYRVQGWDLAIVQEPMQEQGIGDPQIFRVLRENKTSIAQVLEYLVRNNAIDLDKAYRVPTSNPLVHRHWQRTFSVTAKQGQDDRLRQQADHDAAYARAQSEYSQAMDRYRLQQKAIRVEVEQMLTERARAEALAAENQYQAEVAQFNAKVEAKKAELMQQRIAEYERELAAAAQALDAEKRSLQASIEQLDSDYEAGRITRISAYQNERLGYTMRIRELEIEAQTGVSMPAKPSPVTFIVPADYGLVEPRNPGYQARMPSAAERELAIARLEQERGLQKPTPPTPQMLSYDALNVPGQPVDARLSLLLVALETNNTIAVEYLRAARPQVEASGKITLDDDRVLTIGEEDI